MTHRPFNGEQNKRDNQYKGDPPRRVKLGLSTAKTPREENKAQKGSFAKQYGHIRIKWA